MPPKRRTTETETPNNPTEVPLGRPEIPAPAAQPGPVKRQRVSRACDQCRAARERCDGKQPECYPCLSQSRPCTYEAIPKKRGVQTGYIRTLELALGWLLEKVPGSEETLGALLAHESGQQGSSIMLGKDVGGADRLQKRWRKSRVYKGIDRILSGGTAQDGGSPSADASDTEGDAARACSNQSLDGAGSESFPAESPNLPQTGAGHRPRSPSNDEPSSVDWQRQRRPTSSISRFPPSSPDRLKLPPNHWRLLDIYFSYTHSWLPILEKQDLFRASYLYPEQGVVIHPEDPSAAPHAELWAALALAALQDAASSPDDTETARPPPSEIYRIARELLPSENGPFRVHHARALLLLSLANLGQDKPTGAGLLLGSAIRILLGPDALQRGAPDRDGQRTSLCMIACFILETVLSVRCNRPPHLMAEDLAAMPLVTEGGLDEWEPWTPCDGFGAGHPGPRLSRSPAFCLSTFNLLYAIMKVVSVEMLARRRGQPRGVEAPEAFSSQLRRAIDPNLPFGNFISSPSCGTASVPTPYVARATFLWASALADPHSESLLALLEDTLDQYQRRFGKCGMPPFIVACIGSLANEEYMFGFSEQRRERLKSLVSAYKCGSFDERRTSSVAGTTVVDGLTWPAAHEPVGVGDPAHFPRQSTPTTPFAGLAMPSLNDRLTAPQHQQTQPVRGGYKPICGPGMTGSYQGHFRNPPIAVPQGSNAQIQLGTGAGALSATVPAMHQGHTSPHPLAPPAGFGVSPDYDALLDDLASIECTDAVDADAQFMANLGFAPGCDIAEILRRDFGPV